MLRPGILNIMSANSPGTPIGRLRQLLMEPLALPGESLVPLALFLLRHGLKSGGAAAFHYLEAKPIHEVEVLHDLPAS